MYEVIWTALHVASASVCKHTFAEQSAEVSPMYNNIVIINRLAATLPWNETQGNPVQKYGYHLIE